MRKLVDGQGNDLGYGNNVKRLGNPQPSSKFSVSFINNLLLIKSWEHECSSQTKCWWAFIFNYLKRIIIGKLKI